MSGTLLASRSAKKAVAQRLSLLGGDELVDGADGFAERLVEGQRHRVLDAIDHPLRRDLAAIALGGGGAGIGEEGAPIDAVERDLAWLSRRIGVLSAAMRAAKATASASRSPSATASMMPSSRALPARTGSPDTIILSAGPRPISRGRRSIPPAPGTMPILTSGRPTWGARLADAEVAAERDFEPGRRARHRRSPRPPAGARLDLGNRDGEARRLRRLAEFADIGAGDEGLALADQHDRRDGGIGDGSLDAIDQTLPHGDAESVHGRVVDGEDGDGALPCICTVHAIPPVSVGIIEYPARTIRASTATTPCGLQISG